MSCCRAGRQKNRLCHPVSNDRGFRFFSTIAFCTQAQTWPEATGALDGRRPWFLSGRKRSPGSRFCTQTWPEATEATAVAPQRAGPGSRLWITSGPGSRLRTETWPEATGAKTRSNLPDNSGKRGLRFKGCGQAFVAVYSDTFGNHRPLPALTSSSASDKPLAKCPSNGPPIDRWQLRLLFSGHSLSSRPATSQRFSRSFASASVRLVLATDFLQVEPSLSPALLWQRHSASQAT